MKNQLLDFSKSLLNDIEKVRNGSMEFAQARAITLLGNTMIRAVVEARKIALQETL